MCAHGRSHYDNFDVTVIYYNSVATDYFDLYNSKIMHITHYQAIDRKVTTKKHAYFCNSSNTSIKIDYYHSQFF